MEVTDYYFHYSNHDRISSVGRVLDCKVGCCMFNSRGWTNTQGFNPFARGDFAKKRVLKLVEGFSGHCRAIKS